jgi:hypothetical protein
MDEFAELEKYLRKTEKSSGASAARLFTPIRDKGVH